MGSMPFSTLDQMATDLARPPELSDDEYLAEVLLGQDGGIGITLGAGAIGGNGARTEDDLGRELTIRAEALGIEIPASRPSTADKPETSGTESAVTVVTQHARTVSTGSHDSTSTGLSSNHSLVIPATLTETAANLAAVPRRRSRSLNFSHYDKYLSQVDPNLHQPKFVNTAPAPKPERTTSLFSVSTRKSVKEISRNIAERLRLRRAGTSPPVVMIACICCREDFSKEHHALQTLPCGHTYCQNCLMVMVNQATTDESKMPPRCCTQPIPGSIIKTVLNREDQQAFLKAVLQYSTPWETRIFCPNTACGEFVPPQNKINPKHPFEVVCKNCKTRVCVMCKRNAHRFGQDCPSDWELEAVLKMGEKSGWRRCYKCRTLVELSQGCTHMTCRCKAQFCYICGAVWDPVVGCPNFCNGEEELERRRAEEEARMAELEAEKLAQEQAAAIEATEQAEAEMRTAESGAFKLLRKQQELEMARFRTFERKVRWIMWTRHSQDKLRLVERYAELVEKMKERHAKTAQHLEDRQIEAELELRTSLDHQEKSIRIKLKHMEAYCNALGRSPGKDMPSREVTQKHLEQLGQQYHVRDGMARRHQAQINVLREKQAKRMEELMERQEKEMDSMIKRRANEIEDLMARFAEEDETFGRTFEHRRIRMRRRWALAGEILRCELQNLHELRYAIMQLPEWPPERDDNLSNVDEEGGTAPTGAAAVVAQVRI